MSTAAIGGEVPLGLRPTTLTLPSGPATGTPILVPPRLWAAIDGVGATPGRDEQGVGLRPAFNAQRAVDADTQHIAAVALTNRGVDMAEERRAGDSVPVRRKVFDSHST